jgi:hypothetical protein
MDHCRASLTLAVSVGSCGIIGIDGRLSEFRKPGIRGKVADCHGRAATLW